GTGTVPLPRTLGRGGGAGHRRTRRPGCHWTLLVPFRRGPMTPASTSRHSRRGASAGVAGGRFAPRGPLPPPLRGIGIGLAAAQAKSGHKDAVLTGDATLAGIPVALAVMDFEFMGGSMGSVVGEKITRAAERALAERKPLVIVAASGGARMQEGTIALMQL